MALRAERDDGEGAGAKGLPLWWAGWCGLISGAFSISILHVGISLTSDG